MKKLFKFISIALCLIMTFIVCACNYPFDDSQGGNDSSSQIQAPGDGNEDNSTGADDIIQAVASTISYDYNDYIGDLETFVYGLLITKLEYIYDVFPAYVQLSSGYFVYGLGYTDYSECYTNEDESVAYFMSGFIPFVGELDIPQEDFDTGLYLYNIDYQDEETVFVWKYRSEAFSEHCVVYGTYLQYGVDANGQITYNAIPFEREKCDTSLGSLYSYDASRYLYDVDFGEYMPISGVSLAETFDYAEFEKEVNAFIEEQNANWMTYDVETVAYTSQDAVVGYLLSLQVETFLGYPVEQLVELSQGLDPLSCFRITPEGLTVIDIQEIPPEGASALCKWLVGSACAIVAAVGIVASIVFVECPPLSALAGAATGFAIELFMQVVIDNKTLGDVSWAKVGIAAAAGAVSGFLGPYLQTLGGAAYFFVDSAVDGLIGGIEQAVFAMMDGADGSEILSKFGYGFVMGAGISAGFKVAGKVLSKVGQGLSVGAQKIAKKLSPKVTAVLTKFTKPIKNFVGAIGDGIGKLKQKADSSIFHSKFVSKKMLQKAARGSNELITKSMNKLSTADIVDGKGNIISKSDLTTVIKKAKDGDVLGYITKEEGVIAVIKKNGAVGVTFPNTQNVRLTTKTYTDIDVKVIRASNLEEARELFAKKWILDPDSMPEDVAKRIKMDYPDENPSDVLENMISGERYKTKLKEWIDGSHDSLWVLHEELELGVVSLVPKSLHNKSYGANGVSHYGGAALESYIRQHLGAIYFETFINAAASGVVIGGCESGS